MRSATRFPGMGRGRLLVDDQPWRRAKVEHLLGTHQVDVRFVEQLEAWEERRVRVGPERVVLRNLVRRVAEAIGVEDDRYARFVAKPRAGADHVSSELMDHEQFLGQAMALDYPRQVRCDVVHGLRVYRADDLAGDLGRP